MQYSVIGILDQHKKNLFSFSGPAEPPIVAFLALARMVLNKNERVWYDAVDQVARHHADDRWELFSTDSIVNNATDPNGAGATDTFHDKVFVEKGVFLPAADYEAWC